MLVYKYISGAAVTLKLEHPPAYSEENILVKREKNRVVETVGLKIIAQESKIMRIKVK